MSSPNPQHDATPWSLTRSGLFKAGAAAALAAGAGGGVAVALGLQGNDDASAIARPTGGAAYLHHASYVPLVGSTFKITAHHEASEHDARVARTAAATIPLKLVSAEVAKREGTSFSLVFRAPRSAVVNPDGALYRVEHPDLGQFALFLNPVDRGVTHLNLQAVIYRIAT